MKRRFTEGRIIGPIKKHESSEAFGSSRFHRLGGGSNG